MHLFYTNALERLSRSFVYTVRLARRLYTKQPNYNTPCGRYQGAPSKGLLDIKISCSVEKYVAVLF